MTDTRIATMTDRNFPPQGLTPSAEQIQRNLRRAQAVAQRSTQMCHHPFGAVLVGPDQETVLMEQCNIDTVNHAESTLARMAATNYTAEFLWSCTLYTNVEPCCMCAGTAYWANIGRIVFGMTEHRLLECRSESGDIGGVIKPCGMQDFDSRCSEAAVSIGIGTGVLTTVDQ